MKEENVLKEIQIKNFRSLKDTGLQHLAPITVLVGENSSGKSTFLRAFPLLKQSITKRTAGPILWAGDVDDYVDFGSFEETVTNDGSKEIVFRFVFDIGAKGNIDDYGYLQGFVIESLADKKTTHVDYEITIVSSKNREYVSKMNLCVNAIKIKFDFDGNSLIVDDFTFKQPKTVKGSEIQRRAIRGFHVYTEGASSTFGFTLPSIEHLLEELFETLSVPEKNGVSYYIEDAIVKIGDKLSRGLKINETDKISLKEARMPKAIAELNNQLIDTVIAGDKPHVNEIIKVAYVYKLFRTIEVYISKYFRQVHYIAPLRATAERYYRLRNLAVDEVDYQGKNLAIFINSLTPKRLTEFQKWTNKHFGFAVGTGKSKGHLSIHVKLENSQTEINLSDTGFGYSQILPIITQLWELSTKKKSDLWNSYDGTGLVPLIIAIEQPELHLHPAVQARLAKAFIASINLARDNGYQLQLLIETHSETIINYLGRAIAHNQLSKDDVSVILFEKWDAMGTTDVKNSAYNESGFLTNWPYGFFDPME